MKLTLALSKGRIFEETTAILSKIGIRPLEDPEKSRKLIIETSNPDVRLIIVRASDVPTFTYHLIWVLPNAVCRWPCAPVLITLKPFVKDRA